MGKSFRFVYHVDLLFFTSFGIPDKIGILLIYNKTIGFLIGQWGMRWKHILEIENKTLVSFVNWNFDWVWEALSTAMEKCWGRVRLSVSHGKL